MLLPNLSAFKEVHFFREISKSHCTIGILGFWILGQTFWVDQAFGKVPSESQMVPKAVSTPLDGEKPSDSKVNTLLNSKGSSTENSEDHKKGSSNASDKKNKEIVQAKEDSQNSENEENDDTRGPQTIDVLEDALLKLPVQKKVQVLKKAYSLYQKKQFAKAIILAKPIESDPIYSDIAYWLEYLSHKSLALTYKEKKQYESSITSAKKAFAALNILEIEQPYSPHIKDLPKYLAQLEFMIGQSYSKLHKAPLAYKFFERGFARLNVYSGPFLIHSSHALDYIALCNSSKKPSEGCLQWMPRLVSIPSVKRNSQEVSGAFDKFPELREKVKPVNHSVAKLVQTYKAPDLDQAAFEQAMKLVTTNENKSAVKSLRQFLDDFPKSSFRFRARYWLGQMLEQGGEHDKASKVLEDLEVESPLSYYGLLSAQFTNKPIQSKIEAIFPLGADTDPALQNAERFHLERAKQFISAGMHEFAAYELKFLRPREGFSTPFLIYLAMLNERAKNFLVGFQVVNELILRGYSGIFSSFGLKIIFPFEFFELIKKNAEENGLDPLLVLSLIKQESAFEHGAASSVGAMGLMQLMPMTALEVDSSVDPFDLNSPDLNIRLGTKYLKKLIQKFNGNIAMALAGYNAGPTAVDRWLKEPQSKKSLQSFVEAIPYRETREYVSSIIRNYFWYSIKFNGAMPSPGLDYFWTTAATLLKPIQKASHMGQSSMKGRTAKAVPTKHKFKPQIARN